MPREGAIIFRDIVGKLDVLNIECDKCGRGGRYHVYRLIERYGMGAALWHFLSVFGSAAGTERIPRHG
jgi:hypothetical protein